MSWRWRHLPSARLATPAFSLYTPAPTAVKLGFTPGKDAHPFAVEGYTVTQSGDFYPEDRSGIAEYLGNTAALGGYAPTYIVEQKTLRPFSWWITEGGYTADEPEIYMSLRHFYDPQAKGVANFSGNRNVSYLTDISDSVLANWVGRRDESLRGRETLGVERIAL